MKVTAPQPKERDWNVSTAPAITAIRNKIAEMLIADQFPHLGVPNRVVH